MQRLLPISSIKHLSNPILGLIEVTQRCNLNCPICFREASKQDGDSLPSDPSFDAIVQRLVDLKKQRPDIDPTIAFTGGEPTLRDDLPELVAKAHALGYKRTEVMTNGLRLAQDLSYVQELKKAGLSQMGLQFDGFDDSAYTTMRGKPLCQQKLKALDHLKRVKQPTILAGCIMKGINEAEIRTIINFAIKNKDFIEHVNFQTFIRNRHNNHLFKSIHFMDKEEVIAEIEKQMEGKIKRNAFSSPASIIPVPEFIEALTHKPQKQYFPLFHSTCNLTTYVYVNRKKELIPVYEALDMQRLLEYLKTATKKIQRKDSFLNRTGVLLGLTLKMFTLVRVHVFRKMMFQSIGKKEFDPLSNLQEILMISCENYMDSQHYSNERNEKCGLFFMHDKGITPFCQQCID